jgi:cobalamin biosynthesis protein CobC
VHADLDIAAGRFARHGGRLCVAETLFPRAQQPWIDLSTGINPYSYPAPRASRVARNRLPEPTQLARLETAAAAAFGVGAGEHVVATPGTESALRLLPHAIDIDVADVIVAGPTYGSHADAWASAGATARTLADDELHMHAPRADCITIVNPNNPDGRVLDRDRLLALHDTLQKRNGILVVDEAFIELEPALSVAPLAGSKRAPRLIVLRSFGKFFGLAGVRLGFVIAAPGIVARLRSLIGDWPVSSDALAAGIAAYADEQWATRTRNRLARAANRLDALLRNSGFAIVGGTSLFRLVRAADARDRFARLLAAGILVRPFDHDETLLRFGLPKISHEWTRLAAALESRP